MDSQPVKNNERGQTWNMPIVRPELTQETFDAFATNSNDRNQPHKTEKKEQPKFEHHDEEWHNEKWEEEP